MFRSARLKLTTWYLVIIMLISGAFSVAMYRILINEVDRFDQMQRSEIDRRLEESLFGPQTKVRCSQTPASTQDAQLIAETKSRILWSLITVNSAILVISGSLAYILAGRTLSPIKAMVEDQSRFISDASHELRTPLTSLKSSFEVFLRDKRPTIKDAKSLASDSLEDVNKLQSLAESLLQLTQYQKSNGHIKFEKVLLQEVIGEAIKKTQNAAKDKHITINNLTTASNIIGNKFSLIDLLVILIDNAIKYSPAQSQISLNTAQLDGHIQITVTDQGVGISDKDIPHIFKRFYRADTARSKQPSGGYGLGLSIAKRIVELHHGTIAVHSQLNQGTTFIINLPRK